MKGLKGDGVKHSQAKGALAAAETVPLFPRLHVNETEKAGPKAPPRNKMALYEQFTVPSHRFVQANQASATIMCQKNQVQYGPHDYRYSYLPYYMPPVPYASCNSGIQAYALPSHTANTSGTSAGSGVLSDEGQQKVVKNHPTVSPSKGSRRMTEAAADSLTRVLPGQKGKDAGNSHMPRSSFCRNTKKQTSKLSQSVPSCIQKSSTVITDSTQEPLSSVELGLKRIVPDGLLCIEELAESRKVHMTAEGQPKEASRQSDTNMLDERHEQSSSGHSCLQIECGSGSICQDLSAPSDALANVISGNGICTTNKGFYHRVQLSEGQAVIDGQTSLANGHPSDGVQGDGMGCPIGKAFSEPECARAEGWSMAECQMSQPRMKEGRSNESSVSDATCEIKPKVVIHAIGQQQFWKARKALLRQQQIFSDQVFQLHKLRKVQQLLAESPAGTLIDEKMHFETIEKCDSATSAPAKNITHLGARAHKATCDPKDGRKDKALEGAIQPHGTIQGHGGIQAGGKDCGRVQQSVQELGGGSGVSAWGYPSLGPWVGPMGGQGQPFVCEPFAGTLPPGLGSAFGLPYGTAMRGSIPPMISVGVPYYDQMQALAIEMGSNYTLYKQAGGSSGDSSGRDSSHMMSNDLSGSWHVMQHNSLNRQRVHAAGPNKDIPTGSGASVNKSPAAVGSVKTPYFPAAWVSTGQAGVVNTDGLESSGHQSETSSPSVATKHHGSGVYIPAASRQLGFNHSDRGDGIHTGHLASAYMSDNGDQYVRCTNATEIGEVDPGTQGDVIGQKAADIALDVGSLEDNEEVSGHTVNIHALELFPLVPSLSSSGLGHSRKEALGGQGHVIRAVPRRAIAASESVAGILLSLRRERQKQVSC